MITGPAWSQKLREEIATQANAHFESAKALYAAFDYEGARQELETSLRLSDNLGLQVLLAKTQYFLATALRLGGSQSEASHYYSEAHRILDDVRKESNNDAVLKRSDLAPVYQDSARWSQSSKS